MRTTKGALLPLAVSSSTARSTLLDGLGARGFPAGVPAAACSPGPISPTNSAMANAGNAMILMAWLLDHVQLRPPARSFIMLLPCLVVCERWPGVRDQGSG